ncbi:HypC/HybG/HupF family hydrogenase formation chaperone [Nocardia takedensis]|uniref:HypC/HybG/HupF family hydrogenase formation chaperone n=1 Tax=Nocardia takedensis TaxID=259390 RepID=UPI0003016D56|nr:HypC/HybG/HupF family hydrogenase formation chaperone [Nocardia takedensis]
MCLAVPGRVLSLYEHEGAPVAMVDFGGVRKEVCLQFTPEVTLGEYVIVHVGFAIQRLDEESARRTLEEFARLGLLDEEFGEPPVDTRPPGPRDMS